MQFVVFGRHVHEVFLSIAAVHVMCDSSQP